MAVRPIKEEIVPAERQRLRLVPQHPEELATASRNKDDAAPFVFPTKEMIAVLSAISSIIAVRMILLIAVLIGGALGHKAVQAQSWMAMGSAAAYYVGVVFPLVRLTQIKG